MNTINGYLQYLDEGEDYKDPDTPNPYDYQSIDLDPKVTKQDLNILGRWLQKNKKLAHPDDPIDPVEWLFYSSAKSMNREIGTYKEAIKNSRVFTIIDKKKRVGVVGLGGMWGIIWASWVPDHNYAVRGTMKMVEHFINKDKKLYKGGWHTNIYKKNIPSLKVAKKLKMKSLGIEKGSYSMVLKGKEIWWIEKKKGWFKR